MNDAVNEDIVLKLLNVESAYGPIKAIRGVSLQVKKGEIATVLGSKSPSLLHSKSPNLLLSKSPPLLVFLPALCAIPCLQIHSPLG